MINYIYNSVLLIKGFHMAKFILLEALLFLMPFIIFLLYVRIFHKRKAIEALHPKNLAKLIKGYGLYNTLWFSIIIL